MKTQEAKQQVQIGVNQLVEGLKALDSQLSESEIEEVLKEYVLPFLLKDGDLCATSIFNKMEVIKVVDFDSILDEKSNGMQESIRLMNASAICWMVEYHTHITKLLGMIEWKLKYNQDSKDLPSTMEFLDKASKELGTWMLEDAYDRNQLYESELTKLNGRN